MPHGSMHDETWKLKAKCQCMAMHEKWLELRVGIRDTWQYQVSSKLDKEFSTKTKSVRWNRGEKEREERKTKERRERRKENGGGTSANEFLVAE